MELSEIEFERNLSGSYMKITACADAGLDEIMQLRRQIPGLLPVEKCYINGKGQYWYTISGKQSLDTFCKIKPVKAALLEQIIHGICGELDILERYLIDVNCLRLEPELIYITNNTGELSFTVCPDTGEELAAGFQRLTEYLLTKIDHSDARAVQMAYEIYEKTLKDGYSMEDIHASVIDAHMEEAECAVQTAEQGEAEALPALQTDMVEFAAPCRNTSVKPTPEKLLEGFVEKLLGAFMEKPFVRRLREVWKRRGTQSGKRLKPQTECGAVYPEDEIAEEKRPAVHPTICLSDYREHPRGLLLYEGYERFENIPLEERTLFIGQAEELDVTIAKDTVSRYHARIEYENKEYYLEDLNSTNGTFVNDTQLSYKERRKLKSNDIVRFADVRYRFV